MEGGVSPSILSSRACRGMTERGTTLKMDRILFQVSYNGAPFYGWQTQIQSQKSVQSTLQDTFSQLYNQKIIVIGGSRTDRGVHARDQLCSTDIPQAPFPWETLRYRLNSLIHPHIYIHWIKQVSPDFRLHQKIKSKVYYYALYHDKRYSPFLQQWAMWVPPAIACSELLPSYCQVFQGTHDFKIFSNAGTELKSTVRTLYHISYRQWGFLTLLRFHGDGFLKQMVRNIVGTMLQGAQKELDPTMMYQILNQSQKSPAIVTAPPEALTLIRTIL